MTEEPFINIKIGKFRFVSEGQPNYEFNVMDRHNLGRKECEDRNAQRRSDFIGYVEEMVEMALRQEVAK